MARRKKRGDKGWRMPHPKVVARMDTPALCELLPVHREAQRLVRATEYEGTATERRAGEPARPL